MSEKIIKYAYYNNESTDGIILIKVFVHVHHKCNKCLNWRNIKGSENNLHQLAKYKFIWNISVVLKL